MNLQNEYRESPPVMSYGNAIQTDVLPCLWSEHGMHCQFRTADPVELFQHLTEYHIGRKSVRGVPQKQNLECHFDGCNTTFGKRDHAVSHVRIHIPSYKPHKCEQCGQAYSRAQDLRKHEKKHLSENGNVVPITGPTPKRSASFANYGIAMPVTNSGVFHLNNLPDLQVTYDWQSSIPAAPQTAPADFYQLGQHHQARSVPLLSPLGTQKRESSPLGSTEDLHRHSSFAARQQQPNVLSDFLGDIKRKKLEPRYDSNMANVLENVAQAFMPKDEAERVDTPIEDVDWGNLLTSVGVNADSRGDQLKQYNEFFNELYESIRAERAASGVSPARRTPFTPPEPVEEMDSSSDEETQEQIVKETFDPQPVAALKQAVQRLDSSGSAGGREEDVMKFIDFDAGKSKEQLEKIQKMDVLRDSMETLSLQHVKAVFPASADISESIFIRNRFGRFPRAYDDRDMTAATNIRKKKAERSISDPSSVSTAKMEPPKPMPQVVRKLKRSEKRGKSHSRCSSNPLSAPNRNYRESHIQVLQLIMKQLERVWQEVQAI